MLSEEVVAGDDENISQRVLDAEMQPETFAESAFAMKKFKDTYGKYFKTEEDCELFSMLPLNREAKHRVLMDVLNESQKVKE